MLKKLILEKLGIISRFKTIDIQVAGKKIKIPEDMAWCFESGDYYETNFIYWLDKLFELRSNPVFYDIGANYGYYTVKYSTKAKQVYAFEPVGKTFKYLEKNVERNGLKNVRLFKLGISDNKDVKEINLYSSSGNNSLFVRDIPADHPLKKIGSEEIKLSDLDSLFDEQSLLAPDIIKIDVEGAELFVLRGAKEVISKYTPLLIFEYSFNTSKDAGYMPGDLLNEIDLDQYTIYGISEDEKDIQLIPFASFKNKQISNVIAVPKAINALFEKWL